MIYIDLSKTGRNKGLYTAVVDDEYFKLAELNWSVKVIKGNLYARRTVGWPKQSNQFLHRVIMSLELGYELNTDEQIDHIDGNGLNCLVSNMRVATNAQNSKNKQAMGYYRRKDTGRWQAEITVNYRKISLGCYDTENEASAAYKLGRLVHFGEFAYKEE